MKGAGEAGPRTGDSIVWISAQCARNRTVNRTPGKTFRGRKTSPWRNEKSARPFRTHLTNTQTKAIKVREKGQKTRGTPRPMTGLARCPWIGIGNVRREARSEVLCWSATRSIYIACNYGHLFHYRSDAVRMENLTASALCGMVWEI